MEETDVAVEHVGHEVTDARAMTTPGPRTEVRDDPVGSGCIGQEIDARREPVVRGPRIDEGRARLLRSTPTS